MILTIIFKKQKRFPNRNDLNQEIDVKCDICSKEYTSTLRNRDKNIKSYLKDLCRSCKQKHQYSDGLREQQRIIAGRQKGISNKDFYGDDKALEISNNISFNMPDQSGRNNPMYGKNYQCSGLLKISNDNKGKNYEEIYGIEKSIIIKNKLSINNRGSNNPMFGKPSPEGSGYGISGWYDNIFFRSILELYMIKYLIDNNIEFISGEKEEFKIPYIFEGVYKNYFCDYIIGNKRIELKPLFAMKDLKNIEKFKAAKKIYGKDYIILNENDIPYVNTDELKYSYINGDLKFIKKFDDKINIDNILRIFRYNNKKDKNESNNQSKLQEATKK